MNKLYTSIRGWQELKQIVPADLMPLSVQLADSTVRYTASSKVCMLFDDPKTCSMFALKYSEYIKW